MLPGEYWVTADPKCSRCNGSGIVKEPIRSDAVSGFVDDEGSKYEISLCACLMTRPRSSRTE